VQIFDMIVKADHNVEDLHLHLLGLVALFLCTRYIVKDRTKISWLTVNLTAKSQSPKPYQFISGLSTIFNTDFVKIRT